MKMARGEGNAGSMREKENKEERNETGSSAAKKVCKRKEACTTVTEQRRCVHKGADGRTQNVFVRPTLMFIVLRTNQFWSSKVADRRSSSPNLT